jgi:ribosome-binding protein aMBF1 (putative translation factor)
MSDLQKYKAKRKKKNPKFWAGYQERFETIKLGVLLKQARQNAGLTQEQVAKMLKTTKSVVSRMENQIFKDEENTRIITQNSMVP